MTSFTDLVGQCSRGEGRGEGGGGEIERGGGMSMSKGH